MGNTAGSLVKDAEGLNAREKAFVHEYCLDMNAAQACIRAGYSPSTDKSAASIGSELLARPSINGAVERLKAQRLQRCNITAENILAEMHLLANSCLEHYVIDDEGQVRAAEGAPEGAMRAVQSIKRKVRVIPQKDGAPIKEYDVEIKLWDKPTPLKLMGKQIGVFPEKVMLAGPDGGPIQVERVERVIVDPKGGQ